MNKIKLLMICFLLIFGTMGEVWSQDRLNEFVVEVDKTHNPMTIYSSYGVTPNDGVIIINSTIQNLEFNLPAAPGRIQTVIADKRKNRYVLIIQPNDNNYKQYTITINTKGFLQGKIESVIIKSGMSKSYIVNPRYMVNEKYSVGDDAKVFVGVDGFIIAYLDASGRHGFAIKTGEDAWGEKPNLDDCRLLYRNRYSLGLTGEYWTQKEADFLEGLKWHIGGNIFYTFDFTTGKTHTRTYNDYNERHIKRMCILRF